MNLAKWTLFTLCAGGSFSVWANTKKGSEKEPETKTEGKAAAKPSAHGEAKKSEKLDPKKEKSCDALPQETPEQKWAMADCHFKASANMQAVETLKRIRDQNPKDLEAYFHGSWLLWNEGHTMGGEKEKKFSLEALGELEKARLANSTHWQVDTEIGDYYLLRLNMPQKAYPEFLLARKHYDGDFARKVPKAENGRRAAIEDRIAQTAEMLDMKGAAVEASCRALFFDPDDKTAEARVKRLYGSCVRKGVKDPQKKEEKEDAA